MIPSLIIASVWVIGCNLWHVILVATRKGLNRPLTISEHAVETKRILGVHRIVHSLPLLLFMPLAHQLVISERYSLGVLLMAAAIFDCAQVLTLNKRTARLEDRLNAHSITAWLMALSYMGYSLLISREAHVPTLVYVSGFALCVLLLLFAVTNTFKKAFLVMQMSFFILISAMGIIAHLMLISA